MIGSTREARNFVRDELHRYLVGPLEHEETLHELPVDFYHVGILYPRDTPVGKEEVELSDAANMRGEENSGDADILDMASSKSQSAMGMTFYLPLDIEQIKIKVSWGEYAEEEQVTEEPFFCGWRRTPVEHSLMLDLVNEHPPLKLGRLSLYVKMQVVGSQRAITLSLAHSEVYSPRKGENCRSSQAAFQVSMVASLTKGAFQPAPRSHGVRTDEEYNSHELLYRKLKNYAAGHGVAVTWGKEPVRELSTNWLPQVEVSKASPDILPDAQCLDMRWLAEIGDKGELLNALIDLSSAYAQWIDEQFLRLEVELAPEAPSCRERLQTEGHKHLTIARQQLARIEAGIEWLRSSDKALRSFQLANQTIATALGWRFSKKSSGFRPRWRAFQLGFILSAMQGAAEHDHPDRDIVDLIWFPTGGGKTEAYLGLTALVLFHRMLVAEQPECMKGVSVITRYTLRLLTLQQFERTASLLCAANIVKDQQPDYKDWPDFSLGLFVGSASTPNTLEDAEKIRTNVSDVETDCTTLPLTRCPVCHEELSTEFQEIDKTCGKLITRCSDQACLANRREEGICIAVVDEHIYTHPPSVIIGTVDKFALIAWKPEIGALFGRGRNCLPPDLIIQDELHLIGDALGTMVALYETAIDTLASRDNEPVKVIGSTATIRRAAQQVRKIYNREVIQFPPSGIDNDDSFFYQRDKQNPGRLYLGVMAQGRSPKHSLTWLAGILANASTKLPDAVRDPFHTLLLYFNSLRELGGTLVLMEDEVKKYIEAISDAATDGRSLAQIRELTSRLRADELRELLQEMDISWKPGNEDAEEEPVDALLSTNMISVGVDIDRLGMMVMNGQPKSTSEYIQATSRVGRQPGAAGLVVTLYNWSRSRDRSHYERFQDYHQSFYRHVESTSVTPFAPRARDRALHALLVAMYRCMASELDVSSPRSVEDPAGKALIADISHRILFRVESVYQDDPAVDQLVNEVRIHLEDIEQGWIKRLHRVEDHWGALGNFPGKKAGLLMSPDALGLDDDIAADISWRTPTSMREVEQPVNIKLVKTKTHGREVR